MNRLILLCSVLFAVNFASAAIIPRAIIRPEATGTAVKEIKGPHAVYWNPNYSNHKLLITIGGTTSRPEDLTEFAETAAELGYHVISVDYFNLVITTACRDSSDDMCFDKFRREIILGEEGSDLLDVNKENSLLSRLHKLMQYLVNRDSQWSEFFEDGSFKWENVVLMGNSQGAGHAAFLSKMFAVSKVLMLIGPQDHFKTHAAPWIQKEGKTAGSRYYAFLHRDDYFDSKMQLACFKLLCKCQDLKNVIMTSKQVQDTHNSLLTPMFKDEWKQLLAL